MQTEHNWTGLAGDAGELFLHLRAWVEERFVDRAEYEQLQRLYDALQDVTDALREEAMTLVRERNAATERVRVLEEALRPFAKHIGKVDAPVTLKIGDDTWTDTLTGQDFADASHVLNLRNPNYVAWLKERGFNSPEDSQ